jgi:hypothetical protein
MGAAIGTPFSGHRPASAPGDGEGEGVGLAVGDGLSVGEGLAVGEPEREGAGREADRPMMPPSASATTSATEMLIRAPSGS